jgi:hypothetical protein
MAAPRLSVLIVDQRCGVDPPEVRPGEEPRLLAGALLAGELARPIEGLAVLVR